MSGYVGYGSKPALTATKHHFRSTLMNGHRQTGPGGPVRANKRHSTPMAASSHGSACNVAFEAGVFSLPSKSPAQH
jgi:hypothetical protein